MRSILVAGALASLALALAIPKAAAPHLPVVRSVAGLRWPDRSAQLWAESGWNPEAKSPVGAMGLAQFMPGTWRGGQREGWIPAWASPTVPADAIAAQHAYMNQLERQARGWLGPVPKDGGWWDAGLGAYNAGPGSIKKAVRLCDQLGLPLTSWKTTLPRVTGQHARETLDYIPRIYRYRAVLEAS